jgi:hypothetical protein
VAQSRYDTLPKRRSGQDVSIERTQLPKSFPHLQTSG